MAWASISLHCSFIAFYRFLKSLLKLARPLFLLSDDSFIPSMGMKIKVGDSSITLPLALNNGLYYRALCDGRTI
jgi:hypothetical protein